MCRAPNMRWVNFSPGLFNVSRRRDEDFSIAPLPRERTASKVRRYVLALTLAAVIAAALMVLASILGVAIAPLFERADRGNQTLSDS